MTTEEKAKAYDEALEREYEKTRKDIISFVKSRLARFPECKRYVTWLEKQKFIELNKESIINKTHEWFFEHFNTSNYDNTKIITDFSNMSDLLDSFNKIIEG